jgi:cysteine dioxygenase
MTTSTLKTTCTATTDALPARPSRERATLETLFQYLDGLQERAPVRELADALARAEIGCDDVVEHIRFWHRSYARNLVRAGPWYQVLALCWKNGQRSPIHDHIGSSCAVRVLRGVATETRFQVAPSGDIYAVDSRDFLTGSVCGSADTDIHQVSNLQGGSADLVTLHVYSPPLIRMGTYSLTDRSRASELMLLEFSDAAGI